MYLITTRACIDWNKKKRPNVVDTIDHVPEPAGPDVVDVLITAVMKDQLAKVIRNAVAGLTTEQRLAFLLFHYEEKTLPEIAELKGWPIGTVKTRVYGAFKKVQHAVRNFEETGGIHEHDNA